MYILNDGYIQVYYGDEIDKMEISIGHGVCCANENKKVIMIRFLNNTNNYESEFIKKLEPEFKIFNFAKKKLEDQNFCYIEELKNEILTALNFTKKIFDTGECDVLILDEILTAIVKNYIPQETICNLLEHKSPNLSVVLTGESLPKEIAKLSDCVYYIKSQNDIQQKS